MSHSNIAFHQLLKPLSRHEFETEAKKHHAGQKLRSATRWDQFIGMAMSQLSGHQSLRDIQSNLEAQQHKFPSGSGHDCSDLQRSLAGRIVFQSD